MSLYSGRQVFAWCLVSVVFTLLLGIAIGLWAPGILNKFLPKDGSFFTDGSVDTQMLQLLNESDSSEVLPVQTLSSDGFTDDEKNNIDVYQRYSAGVVNISTEVISYDLFFDPFPSAGGTGSGSILDKRGYILTNYHVIEGASKLYVTLANGDRLEARTVGVDPENDLAVIQITPGNRELTVIPLGVSGNLKVGQKVIAIGNPFSFDRTMTTGIVSALGRPIRTKKNLVIQGMIQTDASINPGNSGGPLLDRNGNMIGINTMIYTESGGSVGLGFAVPVDTARRVVPELIRYGAVKRGWIDINAIQLFPELVRYARLPVSQGLLVSKVLAGGQAERSGIKGGRVDQAVRYGRTIIYLGGDIITEIDGVTCTGIADLYQALEDNKPGDKVLVKFVRDGKLVEVNVMLVERPGGYSFE